MNRSFFLCAALTATTQAGTFFDVTTDKSLLSFDTAAPTTFITSTAIKGLKASDGLTNDTGTALLNLTYHPRSVSLPFNCPLLTYNIFGH